MLFIYFFPGFFSKLSFYKSLFRFFEGYDVWAKDINPSNIKIGKNAVLVGYSLGASWALQAWQNNRHAKLILVDPVIGPLPFWRKGFITWFKYCMGEWKNNSLLHRIFTFDGFPLFKRFFINIFKARELYKTDLKKILTQVPPENVKIIIGGNDDYFGGKYTAAFAEEHGIQVTTLKNVGHTWNAEVGRQVYDLAKT